MNCRNICVSRNSRKNALPLLDFRNLLSSKILSDVICPLVGFSVDDGYIMKFVWSLNMDTQTRRKDSRTSSALNFICFLTHFPGFASSISAGIGGKAPKARERSIWLLRVL